MMQNEAIEQQKVVQYCDYKHIPIFAIPNGGKRNAKEAYFMKLSGVKAGVPDLFVPVARNGCHGLFVEMKTGKNKPTENQFEWIELLKAQGFQCSVCWGFDSAKKVIDEYIERE